MIRISSIIISLFFCGELFSQGNPTIKPNPEKIFKDSQLNKKSFVMPQKSFNPNLENFQGKGNINIPIYRTDTLKYSHESSLGLVYTLPESNMPLLKPHVGNQVMPGTSSNSYHFVPNQNGMPNGLPLRKFYFERPVMQPTK